MIVGIYSDHPQSGKTTVKDIFVEHGFVPLSLADPVKESLLVVLESLGVDAPRAYLWGDRKEEIIPELGVTGGFLMSNYATGFFRDTINKDVWLNCLMPKIEDNVDYVVDDLRFENEYHSFDCAIHIIRPDVNKDHGRMERSESRLASYAFDYAFINGGTLEELQEATITTIQEIRREL